MKSKRGVLATALAFVIGGLLPACSGTGGSSLTSNTAGNRGATITIEIKAPPQSATKSVVFTGSRSDHLKNLLATSLGFGISVSGPGITAPITSFANMNTTTHSAFITLTGVPEGVGRVFTVSAYNVAPCPVSATTLPVCTTPPASTVVPISVGTVVHDVSPGNNQIGITLNSVPARIIPPTANVSVNLIPPGGNNQTFQALDADGNNIVGSLWTESGFSGGAGCTFTITSAANPGPITAVTPVCTPQASGYHLGDFLKVVNRNNDPQLTTGPSDAILQVTAVDNSGGADIGAVTAVSIVSPGTFYYSSEVGSGLQPYFSTGSLGAITAAIVPAAGRGTGYAVGDQIQVLGGDGTGVIKVATVGTGGAVNTLSVVNAGKGYGQTIPVTLNGTTFLASAVITGLPSTSLLKVGMLATGAGLGVAPNSILSIDSPTQVTLSVVSTASANVAITFTSDVLVTSTTGAATTANPVITIASTAGLLVGELVTGAGVGAAPNPIVAINNATTFTTLKPNTLAIAPVVLTISPNTTAGTGLTLVVSPPATTILATANVAVNNGGSGYNVGNTFYVAGGTTQALGTVSTVTYGGAVTGVTITSGGLGYAAGGGASSTASTINGTTLTVGGTVLGTFGVGSTLNGVGITPGTMITALGTGTGGAGTYTVNNSQTVSPGELMIAGAGIGTIPVFSAIAGINNISSPQAAVTNVTNIPLVMWKVVTPGANGSFCDQNASFADGVYCAPSALPASPNVTIAAVSTLSPTLAASAPTATVVLTGAGIGVPFQNPPPGEPLAPAVSENNVSHAAVLSWTAPTVGSVANSYQGTYNNGFSNFQAQWNFTGVFSGNVPTSFSIPGTIPPGYAPTFFVQSFDTALALASGPSLAVMSPNGNIAGVVKDVNTLIPIQGANVYLIAGPDTNAAPTLVCKVSWTGNLAPLASFGNIAGQIDASTVTSSDGTNSIVTITDTFTLLAPAAGAVGCGKGYIAGDILEVNDTIGGFNQPALLVVVTTGGGGSILTADFVSGGSGYAAVGAGVSLLVLQNLSNYIDTTVTDGFGLFSFNNVTLWPTYTVAFDGWHQPVVHGAVPYSTPARFAAANPLFTRMYGQSNAGWVVGPTTAGTSSSTSTVTNTGTSTSNSLSTNSVQVVTPSFVHTLSSTGTATATRTLTSVFTDTVITTTTNMFNDTMTLTGTGTGISTTGTFTHTATNTGTSISLTPLD